ncbi:hypothetical protein TNCT_521981 [Trichonephila clavata]|uniref:Uncharacterized protein n=1 Tax=Trichonephila clavata TaxID=2740835 RepID=A0A8X6LUW6_TRICU|nr:hypothetical protein TNCT_521981 [Trichonephila clavata]
MCSYYGNVLHEKIKGRLLGALKQTISLGTELELKGSNWNGKMKRSLALKTAYICHLEMSLLDYAKKEKEGTQNRCFPVTIQHKI